MGKRVKTYTPRMKFELVLESRFVGWVRSL